MQTSKNVNNDVSKDPPITTKGANYQRHTASAHVGYAYGPYAYTLV